MKDRSNRLLFSGWITMAMLALTGGGMTADPASPDHIRPYSKNPLYWQFKGEPVLLIGGSVDDNLFQIDRLEEHLDTLAACGGNYIRNTMSSRDSGNAKPSVKENGLFNLEKPDPDYWNRFETLLLLGFQQKFADKLMSIALKYPNVLYCIDNEPKTRPDWGDGMRNIRIRK